MINTVLLQSTKSQIPDFPAVDLATSGPSIATLLHADSARNTTGADDSLINTQPPPMVPSTAPTAPDRPPPAPDPVTDITLPRTHAPYDCTPHPEMQLVNPPDKAVFANAPDHAILSVSTIVTQHHPTGEWSTTHLHVHWPLPTATTHMNTCVMLSRIPVTAKVCGTP